MGKKKEKGKSGTAVLYLTRKAAMRKLQLNLAQFRKICILKNIFPRDPKNKKKLKGRNKTYYYAKDIAFLAHDPILAKFREFKTLMKKLKKAQAKKNKESEQNIKDKLKYDSYKLDHIIKERYPSFIDALQDLDDPLCMISLFRTLPVTKFTSQKMIKKCNQLYREWQLYCVKSNSLRKVFVSIKGVYFQAEVMGQTITWLAPHEYHTPITKDVDYKVMSTFLEFYISLMGFVLFKLYHDLGLHYPPKLDPVKDAETDGIEALSLQTKEEIKFPQENGIKESKESNEENEIQQQSETRINTLNSQQLLNLDKDNLSSEDEELEEPTVEEDEFQKQQEEKVKATRTLFSNLKFFLNREVPRYVDFIIQSFGGQTSRGYKYDAYQEDDESITHHILDRDSTGRLFITRSYVQPQWIFDSVNENKLLPTAEYAPGVTLPPHLSPFVDDAKEGYIPERREKLNLFHEFGTLAQLEQAENEDEQDDEESEEEKKESEKEEKKNKPLMKRKRMTPEEIAEEEFEKEIQAELEGKPLPKKKLKEEAVLPSEQKTSGLNKMMMRKKDRWLYNRMQYGIKKKKKEVNKLLEKKKKIDEEKKSKK